MYAVVTTEKRGVFFGEVEGNAKPGPGPLVMRNARMAVYWSADVRGVLGLAATGPSKDCRISRAVPELRVVNITAVVCCTPEAAKAWEAAPWK